ncbi:MAG: SpoIIE family protein phosphatase [Phycisphaerales bacterium]
MSTLAATEPLTLWPLAGPPAPAITGDASRPTILGRAAECDARLDAPSVSRRHASLFARGGRWFLADLGSRHGTFVNGLRIAGAPAPLSAGDHITVGPWTFRVRAPSQGASTLHSFDDTREAAARAPVRSVEGRERSLASSRLRVLMDAAERFHAAPDEGALAREVVRAVVEGTSFTRAALVRAVGGAGGVEDIELLAGSERARGESLSATGHPGGPQDAAELPQISRSMLAAAAAGEVVGLQSRPVLREAVSIVHGGVMDVLCAPVHVGPAVDAFLYADAGAGTPAHDPEAATFISALARLCGLALASLRRAALEREQRDLLHELAGARAVQRRIMPAPHGRAGPLRFAFANTPGRIVAGDICGVEERPGGRAVLFIGDVMGKGLGPSLLMASVQAFLRAAMISSDDPQALVGGANDHLAVHSGQGEFASLLLATASEAGVLRCVDAGHGLAALVSGGTARRPQIEGGTPMGILRGVRFGCTEIALAPGDRLVLFSDGLREQQGEGGEEFGLARVMSVLGGSASCEQDVEALFESLRSFAGGDAFADDVTVVSMALA